MRIPLLLAAGLLPLAAGGCASALRTPNTQAQIAAATGVDSAIVFTAQASPLNVVPSSGTALTPAEAIERTLRNSPDIQASLARVRVAQAEAQQARLLPNPVLSVSLRWPEGGGSAIVEAGLAQELISFLTRPGRVSAADHRLRSASVQAVIVALDVLHEVQLRYSAVQALDALVPALEENQKLLRRLIDLAEARLRAGEANRLEVTTLRTQLVGIGLELIQRRLERTEERLALSRLIGEPSGNAAWTLSALNPVVPSNVSEHVWITTALKRRPEAFVRRLELAALGDELAVAGFAVFDGAQGGVDVEREDSTNLGPAASIPIPLFDMGQAQRARLEARRIEVRHELLGVRRRIVEEVRRAHAAFAASAEALRQAEAELVPLAQQRIGQAEAAYRAGFADVTQLVLAEQQLLEAKIRRIELARATVQARYRLERAVGGAGVANRQTKSATPASTTHSDSINEITRPTGPKE